MRITLDTNVVDVAEVVDSARRCGHEIAVVSVTGREVEGSSFTIHLRDLDTVHETAVWGESKWGNAVWASEDSSAVLDEILQIISNGSFPNDRGNLSTGQRRQLRDAMILQSHIREGRDIFVTNDGRAFRRPGPGQRLCERFGVQIMTSEEFVEFCGHPGASEPSE